MDSKANNSKQKNLIRRENTLKLKKGRMETMAFTVYMKDEEQRTLKTKRQNINLM